MAIRSEVTEEWGAVLALFTDEEQRAIVLEAERFEDGLKMINPLAHISTNGALEVIFKLALFLECNQSRKGNRNGR